MLAAEGIPINLHLPCIESEAEARVRNTSEVVGRLLALTAVAVKGEGLDRASVDRFVRAHDIRRWLSAAELAFIKVPRPSAHDRLQFSWRYEAAWVLLWALRHVDGQLGPPRAICDVASLVRTVRDTNDLAVLGLRPANDILNEADLIYRCHWAVREAQLRGKPTPAGLEPGVTMERHHALNWLIGYCDADWDDVTTDT